VKLKLDENLGTRGKSVLVAAGHDACTVAEQSLTSFEDHAIIERCRLEDRCLVTLDLDFANPLVFQPSLYPGIAVLRTRRTQHSPTWRDSSRRWPGHCSRNQSQASCGSSKPAAFAFIRRSLRTEGQAASRGFASRRIFPPSGSFVSFVIAQPSIQPDASTNASILRLSPQQIENGHSHRDAVGDLLENDRVRTVGDLRGDLDAAVDRSGMHDQTIGLQQFRAFLR